MVKVAQLRSLSCTPLQEAFHVIAVEYAESQGKALVCKSALHQLRTQAEGRIAAETQEYRDQIEELQTQVNERNSKIAGLEKDLEAFTKASQVTIVQKVIDFAFVNQSKKAADLFFDYLTSTSKPSKERSKIRSRAINALARFDKMASSLIDPRKSK